jgi:hypothetical protein
MRNPFKREPSVNETAALVPRANVGRNLYQSLSGANIESIYTSSTRYCDELVRDHVIDKSIPQHRERVSNEDPLGILITRVFSCMAYARAPKFYASDEPNAPEIMQDVRAILGQIRAYDICAEAGKEVLTHGQVEAYMWADMDENGLPTLKSDIYSAMQITPADIIRDEQNRIVKWMVRGRFPPVPAG